MKKFGKMIVILCIGFFLPIGYIYSYDETSVTDFPGLGHNYNGCHNDPDAIFFSISGYVNLTSELGNIVGSREEFTLSAKIQDFTEAAGQLISLGFSNQRGNNDQFDFAPAVVGDLSIDPSGNALSQDFTVTAPILTGNFTITIDALSGSIGGGDEALNWTFGSIGITVEGVSVPPISPPTPELILLGTLSSLSVLAIVMSLLIKFIIDSFRQKRVEKDK